MENVLTPNYFIHLMLPKETKTIPVKLSLQLHSPGFVHDPCLQPSPGVHSVQLAPVQPPLHVHVSGTYTLL